MRAGRLKQKISIITRSETTDSAGGKSYFWLETLQTRARVRPLRGRELLAAQASKNESTVVFYMRYVSWIAPATCKILYNSKNYDITSVVNINEANRELEIYTTGGRSEG